MEILSQMLARNASLLADRAFIVTTQNSLTYSEFSVRTAQLANVLAAKGVTKGDRVGPLSSSTPLMAIGFWACQRLGAIPAPVSAMFRHSELRTIVKQAGMAALVADATTWSYFSEIEGEFPSLLTLVASGDGSESDLESLIAAAPETFSDAACAMDDVAALFFTSGTTGTPKGTAQTHFNQCSTLRDMVGPQSPLRK